MTNNTANQLWFTAPFQVEVRTASIIPPAAGEVQVRTRYSAVSPGSELLLYRGQLPDSLALDSSIESLQGASHYPVQYGYACVGEVQQTGADVDPAWLGKTVFSFQPHASHFNAHPDQLIPVPNDIPAEAAVFLPNMETAVNLAQDGQPMLGERVVVLGQGVVGLLLSGVLSQYPLASLKAVEGQRNRQELARQLGVQAVINPADATPKQQPDLADADLIYEISGHPDALNLAIGLSGYASRIVIGSWYGNKPVSVDLGGEAHRNRLQLITSQVSTLAPALSGRWSKQRRFDVAWEMIRRLDPTQLITHRLPLREAGTLYQQLHDAQAGPQTGRQTGIVQPLFDYSAD